MYLQSIYFLAPIYLPYSSAFIYLPYLPPAFFLFFPFLQCAPTYLSIPHFLPTLPTLPNYLIQPNRSPVTLFHIRNKASQIIKLPTSNFAG